MAGTARGRERTGTTRPERKACMPARPSSSTTRATLVRVPVSARVRTRAASLAEDDDLCLRLKQARRPMIIAPQVRARHRSRGSVRGQRPWRAEYLRGYHHAQSKLIFSGRHMGQAQALRLRWRLLLGTALSLPVRLLLPKPGLVARMWGRLRGAWD